jgi:hypothetical protein
VGSALARLSPPYDQSILPPENRHHISSVMPALVAGIPLMKALHS